MTLQEFLEQQFSHWSPLAPEILTRTKGSITLDWQQVEPWQFIADRLLYRLEKNDKIPPWVVVYRGGKTAKEIDNLAQRYPHRFRLKVIVKAEAVPTLASRALDYYGDEQIVREKVGDGKQNVEVARIGDVMTEKVDPASDHRIAKTVHNLADNKEEEDNTHVVNERGDSDSNIHADKSDESTNTNDEIEETRITRSTSTAERKWLESQWSEEAWSNTDTDGSSAKCFCMAVRCGYVKQVLIMLEERAELIGIMNPVNGFTPLATAVRSGDINMVRLLINAGAELDQPSSTGQTPLHIAVLTSRLTIVDLLMEKGADFQARDVNGLRVEHYAVDSCAPAVLRHVLECGGDVTVRDSNGWTPLFRALCQGADTAIIEELVVRGSEIDTVDRAGLPLTSVARIMTNRLGRGRDSVLRLVDMNYPHEMALANFTRLTKKIYNVHSLLKLPSLTKKPNPKN